MITINEGKDSIIIEHDINRNIYSELIRGL